ncbi:2-amino-4-hydroxy-6-hydroxymethyldihydropteridine diphosphokinase [Acetivibrio cellulolyticus]|uniref:2-amino-4-hydroxy-6- hydroxymethyldihydropteridine diphosphokinase n=1 Tax=Acetivibrio cellulolyticus TaxID=35830 RepID=UPI0001E2DEDB|nr:2-amino-4-hydroxy-6-hydroxymethyldihydropteridine diphosphokinase [Acetivibrio cellulolyticus]
MHKAFLSLGSNLGDRENNLIQAVEEIEKNADIKITCASCIYETDPVGYIDQDRFLNMAVAVETSLSPLKLLEELQRVEKLLKRTREIHWGPRTIDIDILIFDDLEISLAQLVIPHPRMFERAFVLIPLMDLCRDEDLPTEKLRDYIDKCTDKNGVVMYKKFELGN